MAEEYERANKAIQSRNCAYFVFEVENKHQDRSQNQHYQEGQRQEIDVSVHRNSRNNSSISLITVITVIIIIGTVSFIDHSYHSITSSVGRIVNLIIRTIRNAKLTAYQQLP